MMNREMLKLRKDPTIPLSAATVTTSTTNAFPVSPRLGSSEGRGSGGRHRASPKGVGPGSASGSGSTLTVATTASVTAVASMTPTTSTPSTITTAISTAVGTTGSASTVGSGPGIVSAGGGTGASSGPSIGLGNGHTSQASSGTNSPSEALRRKKTPRIGTKTFKFDTTGALWALSASPDFSMVAVVGRDVLKILSVTDSGAEEMINLKTVGIRNNFTGSTDVKWGPTSGSVMETKDIVREVQFNPVSTNDIVAGYESGNIQRWDLRNLSSSEKKFMAHMGFVTSLDYHPNGRFLASGGRDRTIKVWDMEDEKRREIHSIPTIQYTSKVQWRPNKPYHLAASFKDESTVQIFDVRRPFVPVHVLSQHDKDATSILWRDTDVLWTVSKDKTFSSTHIRSQPLSADLLPSGNAAMNCYGQLAFMVSSKGGHDSFERDLVPRPSRPNAKSAALDGSAEAANKQNDSQVPDDEGDDSDDSETQLVRPVVPSLFAIKVSDAPVKRDWSHDDTIRSLLEYYAELGEVQMCVTILLVLASEKDVPEFSRSQQWFGSYIDLLSRFKLWSIATAVSQACKDPGIHTMNQDSTTIHTSCSSCMKPILTRAPTSSGFWACDRCRKVLSSCSVCHKTVRGIFTWCTQCSHGFHLQHAQEWFSQSAECPTGCGHQCFPEMLKVQQEQEQQQQFPHRHTPDDDMTHDPSLQFHHPRPVHPHQEQASYMAHGHHRTGETLEGKGSPLPYNTTTSASATYAGMS
ncbi:WD repeat-containing protein 24 [Dissophora ornata]|nr:WD repeat-containing protein 24 [Dissophora ornata]